MHTLYVLAGPNVVLKTTSSYDIKPSKNNRLKIEKVGKGRDGWDLNKKKQCRRI